MITLVSGSAAPSTKLNRSFHGAGIPILEGWRAYRNFTSNFGKSFERVKIGTVGHVLDNLDVKSKQMEKSP